MSLKQEQHVLLQDILAVAKDLGRVPTRDEYQNLGRFSKDKIVKEFGSWTHLMHASGLEYTKGKRSKQELKKEAFEHLKKEVELAPKVPHPPLITSNMLVIGDLHAPYHHPDAIQFILALNKKYGFDLVCSVGDEIDLHAISFHDHDPDLLSPGHELEAAIKALKPLYEAIPRMLIAESNHGSLVFRKAKHSGLPARVFKSYREILEAPVGWEWRFEICVQMNTGKKVLIHHSYGSNVLAQSQKRGVSCIFGHHHTKQSIQHWSNYDQDYFAAFTGSLIDPVALAMAYNKNNVERPQLGCTRVTNGVPHILRMELNQEGRWNGVVP